MPSRSFSPLLTDQETRLLVALDDSNRCGYPFMTGSEHDFAGLEELARKKLVQRTRKQVTTWMAVLVFQITSAGQAAIDHQRRRN